MNTIKTYPATLSAYLVALLLTAAIYLSLGHPGLAGHLNRGYQKLPAITRAATGYIGILLHQAPLDKSSPSKHFYPLLSSFKAYCHLPEAVAANEQQQAGSQKLNNGVTM